jgi:hypothetical protein
MYAIVIYVDSYFVNGLRENLRMEYRFFDGFRIYINRPCQTSANWYGQLNILCVMPSLGEGPRFPNMGRCNALNMGRWPYKAHRRPILGTHSNMQTVPSHYTNRVVAPKLSTLRETCSNFGSKCRGDKIFEPVNTAAINMHI